MPQKHKPKRLEEMALVAVSGWINLIGRDFIEFKAIMKQQDPNQEQVHLEGWLAEVRETLFAMVPWYLFDKVAEQVLMTVNELIDETKTRFGKRRRKKIFKSEPSIADILTEVALHPHIKQLNVSKWPKTMQHFLYKNVCQLTNIEDLTLRSRSDGFGTLQTEKYLLPGLQSMINLTTFCLYFDTTNAIISALGNNCSALQKLDMTGSFLVTDEGLPPLFNCKKLKEVILVETSVTVVGLKELLLNLPDIQSLGKCNDFGRVLELLHDQNSNPVSLKALKCDELTFKQLELLVHYCPSLKSVSFSYDEEEIINLTILKKLQNLNDLVLSNCDFSSDNLKQVLECIGCNLDLLHLEYSAEIDLNALKYISQYCPNLKDIAFYNCEFDNHNPVHFDLNRLDVSPFAHLQRLRVSDCSQDHLKFLMNHCKNVKFIDVTDMNEATMSCVLAQNPMSSLEELKITQSSDLSMRSVELLMTHCDQLHAISNLESWAGISPSQLADFRVYIRSNNINLDTTSTLF